MIIAHCFLREMKRGEFYLMCETSATAGLEPPFPRPAVMFEVELGENRDEWAEQVKVRILGMRPDLEFAHVLKPREAAKGRPPAFDLAFRERTDAKPKGLFAKLMKGKK
jgi:hypothetical protein